MADIRCIYIQIPYNNSSRLIDELPYQGEQVRRDRSREEPREPMMGQRCDVTRLFASLNNDFRLIAACTYERRVQAGHGTKRKPSVRFVFRTRKENRQGEPGIERIGPGLFEELSGQAFWDVQIWDNPFYEKDAPTDSRLYSLVFSARLPKIGSDGKLITERPRSTQGNPTKQQPTVPVQAKNSVIYNDGGFVIEPVTFISAA